MAAAKARGIKLGSPKLIGGDQASAVAAAKVKRELADEYAADVLPFINDARDAGAKSLGQIAKALVARGVLTPGGNTNWTHNQVRRIIERSAE